MRALLDVNALIAFGIREHEFHERVADWIRELQSEGTLELATCSITELGFVRVVAATAVYGFTAAQARELLLRIKARYTNVFSFITDAHDVSHLPSWVERPRQVTDGHLLRLARKNGAALATLDRGIPGAYLIPPMG